MRVSLRFMLLSSLAVSYRQHLQPTRTFARSTGRIAERLGQTRAEGEKAYTVTVDQTAG
jgi:hypothetical protein